MDVVLSPASAGSRGDPPGLVAGLEDLLGCRVDVLVDVELPAEARQRLLAEAVAL